MLEFIHCFVETLDRYFGNVCELDIMYHVDTALYILDEMMAGGNIVETNKTLILQPIELIAKAAAGMS
jgi:AP-4 complex subunit sigma-1